MCFIGLCLAVDSGKLVGTLSKVSRVKVKAVGQRLHGSRSNVMFIKVINVLQRKAGGLTITSSCFIIL